MAMKLKERIRQSIAKRQGNVILRRELIGLGGRTQLSEALRALQDEGVLERLGSGVYSKTTLAGDSSPPTLAEIAKETYRKLGLEVEAAIVKPHRIDVQMSGRRTSTRSLKIAGHKVRVTQPASKAQAIPENVDALPTKGVAAYVTHLAKAYNVSYERTLVEAWAEAVTRAAGNDVEPDKIRGLLVRLKQEEVLNPAQFTRLLVNYHRERSVV